jgi:hypothetical protein
VKLFEDIYKAVVASYIDGQPAWLVDPEHSAIRVLSRQEIETMEAGDVQDLFRMHHVVIRDQFQPTLAFDENGLKTLADLKKPITLQGGCFLQLLCQLLTV